jgi:glyoxylase-like metal-dependent hydrolase (beta-lactamase superfamily II)
MPNFARSAPSRRHVLTGAAAAATASLTGTFHAGPGFAKAPMANNQAPSFYRFKLGSFEATVVSDGPLALGPPSGDVFSGVSKEEMHKVLADNFLPTENVELEQNAFVINTGDRIVLFDTGIGSAKVFGPNTGRLVSSLKAAGIEPQDVDAIALTHAHPDHCWALLDENGTRNFPNAQIYMAQADLEFWTDEGKLSNPAIGSFIDGARKQLLPNRDRIVFVRDGQEFLPGIQAMAAPGHTVGHTIYLITSQGKTVCNTGDIAHHHVLSVERPRLIFAYDTDGNQAVSSRLRVLDMLASNRTPFVAYHFVWPGIGHVAKQGDGYRYFAAPMRVVL